MAEKEHEELCNCSYCKKGRKQKTESKRRKKAGEEDAPPHHFHTNYTIEAGPGDEDYEPDPAESSLKPNNDYRNFDRNLSITMKNQRKMISARGTKPPSSPTEAYQNLTGKT
jgi:hypothetical protein